MMPGGAELSEKLPDELFQLVESFKKFLREQKAYKDQKFYVDPMLEVDREAEDLMLSFQRVSVGSDINRRLIEQIKEDTTKLLRQAEMAYSLLRAHTPNNPTFQQQQQQQHLNLQQPSHNMSGLFPGQASGVNLNNTSQFSQQQQQQQTINQPAQYFAGLADQFESRMKLYGERIKELKTSLDGIARTHNPEELFKWLEKQHKTLCEIGDKVYMTHERIMEKKAELDKMNHVQLTNTS